MLQRNQCMIKNEALEYARSPIIFALAVTFVFVIGGLIWAIFAPLASAAHAHDVVDQVLSEVLKGIEHISISLTTALDKVFVAEELLKGILIGAPIAGIVNQISK